ncbi:hypothetical protein H6G97_47375 [Nostoc flagelliforme FACHB-838]|uniref:Uncharacterized protein n=1 Tax=Nostoc flagelliforme FACHB-838 TaxID=2692904 RepID=A0ABR8E438_9NOSO|nr:hypothetical protein [Nostoc flagelliforme]MBD2536497.1 hypothetical protein [Nostoc flagelliforme FACHB-838]
MVCEEADFSCAFCDPPSPAYERCFELFLAISDIRGQHFRLGTTLYRVFQDVGLVAPSVSLVQPVVVRSNAKHLVDLSLRQLMLSLKLD